LWKTKDINTFIEFIIPYITKLFKEKNAKTFKNKHFLLFSNLILQYKEVINKFKTISSTIRSELNYTFIVDFKMYTYFFETIANKNMFKRLKLYI
jgi:hypothetical protein